MSDSNANYGGGGIGCGTVFFIVFLVLKLTHVIDWSWWWVTAPLWIGPVLFLVVLLIAVVIAAIVSLLDGK